MEIQWMIFAKEFINNTDSTMDIRGIFHHINTYVFKEKRVSFLLIAKVNPDISEVGQIKDVVVVVNHIKEGTRGFFRTVYEVHDLATWANRIPYMILPLKHLELPYSGEYTFSIFVDKEKKGEESIIVSTNKGGVK